MDEKQLVSNLQSHISDNLSPPVRTPGFEDERPLPAVIIDDWMITDVKYHNKQKVQESVGDFDADGQDEVKLLYRYHYRAEVDFMIRHENDVSASDLKTALVEQLRKLNINPSLLHDDVKWVKVTSSGGPRYVFREPKESELSVSIRLESYHDIELGEAEHDLDPIEAIENSLDVEDSAVHSGTVQ